MLVYDVGMMFVLEERMAKPFLKVVQPIENMPRTCH
jgi:hypothetical protein